MALPDPPPNLNLQESRLPELFSSLLVTWIFAVVTVTLRFVARRVLRNAIWKEDWLILFALIPATIHVFTTLIYMVGHGFGKHIWAGPPDAGRVWAIGLFISEIAYTLTVVFVKYSSLSFYWRIFSSDKTIRTPIWILFGIVSGWGIALILITLLQCFPLYAYWQRLDPINPLAPSEFNCWVDSNKFFTGNSIPNIITDAFIVLLPLPYVWNLKLSTPQRLALGGIFTLGIFVTIVAGVRLMFILQVDATDVDITWTFTDAAIWTNVEGNLAIAGCCLPSIKPIIDMAWRGFSNTLTNSSMSKSHNQSTNGFGSKAGGMPSYLGSNLHSNVSKGDEELGAFRRLSEADSRTGSESAIPLTDMPKDKITVTHHVHIHSSQLRDERDD
ncbi:hypothetical protein F4808DRAFT_196829 [Astrocystis sublimbata]|nr:hypothetical protein F4808DRAFT_196829 [Astrocystis sublimbata]